MMGIGELILISIFASIILIILILVAVFSGRPEADPQTMDGTPRLVRFPQRAALGGICAGFAYRFGLPPWITRVGMVLLVFFTGLGVLMYVALWIFMPKATHLPDDYEARTERL